MRARWWLALIALLGCSTAAKVHPKPALAFDILQPLRGYTGLTSSSTACDAQGACRLVIKEWPIDTADQRKELRDLKFVCRVNDKIYRIAQDSPGLIYETYRKDDGCWLFCDKKEVVLDYIPIAETERLLNARTLCYSWANHPIDMEL